jgi:acetoin utilization deacetylase AcuC-like enzyme
MLKASNKTGLIFFPAFDWAISPTHPEREERLLYTQDQVLEEGLFDIEGINEFKSELVDIKDVQRVHFSYPDAWRVMTESHFISAGGAKTIAKAVMNKSVTNGFALVRPPGHHAMRVVHGGRGFCNVNNEAIMVEYLRQAYGIDRVAIIDTDCHHGDGTQDIYWHDPDTLYISMHQDGRTMYPGTGFTQEMGGPTAFGTTINIPLPPYTGEQGILHALTEVVLPVIEEFKPELVINSAGQDNHFTDPLTNMLFTAKGYADLTRLLKPDIVVLEGGYSIEGALPYVNIGIILALAGVDYGHVVEPGYDPEKLKQTETVTKSVEQSCRSVYSAWKDREAAGEKMRGDQEFFERKRDIFYDTDGIYEKQRETLRLCRDCAGVLKIDSTSDRGAHLLAIHVPRKACDRCRQTGHDWYDSAKLSDYPMVCLQDRIADTYQVRGG